MERLKFILADKIIKISSENNDSTRAILDKVNRFRDFANACEALMQKYDGIEDELIRMIEANDFNTKEASSRVNNIIREAENGSSAVNHPEVVPESDSISITNPTEASDLEIIGSELAVDLDTKDEGVEDQSNPTDIPQSNYTAKENVEFEYSEENKYKRQIVRILIVLGVVVAVILLILIVSFVIANWKTLLIVAGVVAAIGTVLWFFANKKNNNEFE
jgi:hypothetical protein